MIKAPLPRAVFKQTPEDFRVVELPAYPASGSGEHVFVTFRKQGLTTPEAVNRLAKLLSVSPRDAGVAGMKDKHAVTEQTASFQVPRGVDPEASLAGAREAGLEVLAVARHGNKLKPGHLRGNRFEVVLRGLVGDERATVEAALLDARANGVPNAFGDQRFGRAGDNAARALAVLTGAQKPPRDRNQIRFLFSAFQSSLFNQVLALRVEDNSWATVLVGDVAKKHDTGGLFDVASDDLEEARGRASARLISATGPMFGASMRRAGAAVGELEQHVLAGSGVSEEQLTAHRALGEGTRRALRMVPEELRWTELEDGLRVEFVLDKGSYATTLLGAVCTLAEPPRERSQSTEEAPPVDG